MDNFLSVFVFFGVSENGALEEFRLETDEAATFRFCSCLQQLRKLAVFISHSLKCFFNINSGDMWSFEQATKEEIC